MADAEYLCVMNGKTSKYLSTGHIKADMPIVQSEVYAHLIESTVMGTMNRQIADGLI